MMKAYFKIMVVLAAVILPATPALADSWNVGNSITYSLSNAVYAPGYGYGGLFRITNVNTGAVINTFCIELPEHIYNGSLVAGISNSAVLGGLGGGSPDPISSETNWLYAQYVAGNSLYQNAAALQIAFWILENEVTAEQAALWFNAALLAIANGYIAAAPTTGSYGTQVLNLMAANGTPHQSQLIYVPEPGILILLGIALSAVGLAARRYKF